MNRIRIIISGLVALAFVIVVLWQAIKWTAMRVYVPENMVLVITSKFGDELPNDRVVVPAGDTKSKGVLEEVYGPGRYFINPVEYSTELQPQVEIPAGDPTKWVFDPHGRLSDPSSAPMVGIVTMKEGKAAPDGLEVVPRGFKGVQREVLTPGTYKINSYQMDVKLAPAVIVPPGSVGVKTVLVDDAVAAAATAPVAPTTNRVVDSDNQRGIQREVLQPGIYYLNPRVAQVTIVPVGYDEITLDHDAQSAVRFYSADGYEVEADFTVVWGRSPNDAPEIVAAIGNVDRIEKNVIEPAMKAACQNEGAKHRAKELIQGESREKFQEDLARSLEQQLKPRNLHALLALVRNITIHAQAGTDKVGLLQTIQRTNIEIERDLTNLEQTKTATTKAEYEQALKLVDVAKETVASDTKLKVANILAEGEKKAAEIDAQKEVSIASISLQIAELEAQRTQIMGKAGADVDRMKKEADAKGSKMLIDAFGSAQAYNLYTFAKNFQPTELRMIFAGPGTFWTDLKNFTDIGAAKQMQGK